MVWALSSPWLGWLRGQAWADYFMLFVARHPQIW
jgi:hypothetical protein